MNNKTDKYLKVACINCTGRRCINLLSFIFVSVVIFSLFGCSSLGNMFSVSVNSMSLQSMSQKKNAIILPGNEGVSLTDLQFIEFKTCLKRALEDKGFVITRTADNADVVILLSYGIGDPKDHQYSYVYPVRQTVYSSGGWPINSYVTGYGRNSGSYTTYFRYVDIQAFDLIEYQKSEQLVMLWQTTIASRGSSADLRYVFPVLIGAAGDYLATDTESFVEININENDRRIKHARGLEDQ